MTQELLKKDDRQQVVQHSATTPNDLLTMAVQQGADIDKLEKLMALQERWEKSEAKKAYDHSMNAFHADPPEVVKNKTVKFNDTKYHHVSLDHLAGAVSEKMAPHGLSFRWDTEQLEGGLIKVSCVITHEQGHSERVSLSASPDQSGKKNNIQAIGSTVRYLQRYTLEAAAGVASKDKNDDDGQGAGPEIERITEDQANELHAMAEENGVMEPFMQWLRSTMKVDSIAEIRADAFEMVSKKLDTSIQARKPK